MIIRYEIGTGRILNIYEDWSSDEQKKQLQGTELLYIPNEKAPDNFRNLYATENGYKIKNNKIKRKKNIIIRILRNILSLIPGIIKILLSVFISKF
jgi:hypothetical protein